MKKLAKILGLLVLLLLVYIGIRVGPKLYDRYQIASSLNASVLNDPLTDADLEAAQGLAQGEIYSQELFNLKDVAPVWEQIAENDQIKPAYAHLEKVNFYVITYKSDDQLVNGILATPKREGKFPVVIFNRGGNKETGAAAKATTLFTLVHAGASLIDEGYVMIASCYRENDQFGGEDIHDVLNLTETVKHIDQADADRIGMIGWSRGGMMTYLALKHSDKIKTAVVGNGPSDLESLIQDRPEMETRVYEKLIPNYHTNKTEELKKRSVIHWADQLNKDTSLLILCGTEDQRVNPQQADNIAAELDAINYNYTLKKYQTDHGFSTKKEELKQELSQWFGEHL